RHRAGRGGPTGWCDGDERAGKCGTGDAVPIRVELVNRESIAKKPNYSEVIGAAQWRCTGLQPRIGGEESEFAGGRVERDNLRRWVSSVHLRFVQCPDAGILKGSAGRIVKHVGGHVNA